MTIEPRLDIIGAALADPSRSRILCELMDGRAFTNKELACAAAITPQTASAHLKQLETAGLTTSLRSGRHVYHRISNAEVAGILENMASLSPTDHISRHSLSSSQTRLARSCYNHIAGRLGVLMTNRLAASKVLHIENEGVSPGRKYQAFLEGIGIKSGPDRRAKPIVKLCLDWTERRHHISGPLATAIMQKALDKRWIERRTGCRSLAITADGYDAFGRFFGLQKVDIDGSRGAQEYGR